MTAVLRSASPEMCDEAALVLSALEIPFERAREGRVHVLIVADADAARASAELVDYLREPPLVEAEPRRVARGRAWPGAVVYVALLGALHWAATYGAFGRAWYAAGRLDGERFREGEWWRAVTSLGLHAGAGHLVSNVVFGALFGALLAEACGAGLAWLLFLAAGVLGNVADVVLRPEPHTAVGASTAIFGAIGALGAHEWVRGFHGARDVLRRAAPLVGGVILLGYLGGGGGSAENTDVLAHVTGFVAGTALGLVAAAWRPLRTAGTRLQALCAAAALVVFAAGWCVALAG